MSKWDEISDKVKAKMARQDIPPEDKNTWASLL